MLFRFSAIAFDGHRIHYDEPYATGVELYPGIVVHAPLIASLCLDLPARSSARTASVDFSFRQIFPPFADGPLRIATRQQPRLHGEREQPRNRRATARLV